MNALVLIVIDAVGFYCVSTDNPALHLAGFTGVMVINAAVIMGVLASV